MNAVNNIQRVVELAPVFEGPSPDMGIIKSTRLQPPPLPLDVFGGWSNWISETAEGKAAPADYVAVSLLISSASLIGNARTVSPWAGWVEPCILWGALIGPPSHNKSPALDPITRILSLMEMDLARDYQSTLLRWNTDAEAAKQSYQAWQENVAKAIKSGGDVPVQPQSAVAPDKPARPRLKVSDITPEELCNVLAGCPKGVLQVRDELSGWLLDMDKYGGGGERPIYLQAYGGRGYTVDRRSLSNPIIIPRMSVSVLGGIQPDRLASCIMAGDDDGLSARFLYCWPNKVPARRPRQIADDKAATVALQRLADLALIFKEPEGYEPACIPLGSEAANEFEVWWRAHQNKTEAASGKIASHYGKLPGIVLRISLVLEYMWWAMEAGAAEPREVGTRAVIGAIALADEYFVPMAVRAFGDAALPEDRRLASALARHIVANKTRRINARDLYREGRVPGISDREKAETAVAYLVECDWLTPSPGRAGETVGRQRKDYDVNPKVFEVGHG
jgi:hypothetical protein